MSPYINRKVVISITKIAIVVSMLLAVLVHLTHSPVLALAYFAAVVVFFLVMETIATTVFLHRFLTHGAVQFHNKYVQLFFVWWVRSGGVKFAEWVLIHFMHHLFTDKPLDPHSPFYKNILTGRGPLKRPLYFWYNAYMYRGMAKFFAAYRNDHNGVEYLTAIPLPENKQKQLAFLLERLHELEWAHKDYDKTLKGQLIKLTIITINAIPLVLSYGPIAILAIPAGYLFTVVFYLLGGAIINFWGHHNLKGFYNKLKELAHWSNIPWFWRWLTGWMMGEGWHETHHDAEGSAKFDLVHSLDPGWWVIYVLMRLGLATDVWIAEYEAPHIYHYRRHPKSRYHHPTLAKV